MKRRIAALTFLFLFLANMPVFSGDLNEAKSLFNKGNASYDSEDFDVAVAHYEEALNSGYASGQLYYNLGNAYFKNGSLGKAVANYMRAERLLPNDADIKANLAYAKSMIKGGLISTEKAWLERVFDKSAGLFSLDGITRLSSIIYLLLAAAVILFILVKDFRNITRYLIAPLALSLAVSIVLLIAKFHDIVIERKAVVISETVDSKFEPFDDTTTFFKLYEGERVYVVNGKDNWLKIKRADGRQGWIKALELETL